MADKTPEYGAVSMAGLVIPGGHLSFSTGIEVQFKKNPGFGYKVIDVVKNEHALRALDGSSMAIGLFHELEEYCDLEKASFIKKATKIILDEAIKETFHTAADFDKTKSGVDLMMDRIFDAGARFVDQNPAVTRNFENWDAATIVAKLCDFVRMIARKRSGQLSDSLILECYGESGYTYERHMDLAVMIFDDFTGRESRLALTSFLGKEGEYI